MNSTNPKILLVEDDLNFGNILRSYLELNDFNVELRIDGKQAWSTFMREKFDVCIFDVMMPEMDGFSLAKEIRTVNQKVPIIFLTAKTLREDMIEGFQAGGDDYITKPFDSEVLLYRIRAILRRGTSETSARNDLFQIGHYQFNARLRSLKIGDTEYKLTPKESDLLKMLCVSKDDLLLRKEALLKIWGDDNYFTTRSMDVFIAKLRKYLKDDPNIEILNVHGNGYQLIIKDLNPNSL
jgi:two-component system OmpR family response regulator